MLSLLLHEIRSRRTPILGWSIGLSFYAALYVGIWPQMADQMSGFEDLDIYAAMGMSIATFEGYLGSTVILFMPLILGIYALIAGTATLAGEEERGTLELLVTTRLPRWKIVTAKAIALEIVLLIILMIVGLSAALVFASIAGQVQTTVTPFQLWLTFLSSWPLLVAFAMLGMFLGALLPTRRLALTVAILVYLVSYFGENLSGMLSSLEWLKPFSLFSYRDSTSAVFTEGINLGDLSVLVVVALVFFALAVVSFARRDLTVAAWPWQRAQIPAGERRAAARQPLPGEPT